MPSRTEPRDDRMLNQAEQKFVAEFPLHNTPTAAARAAGLINPSSTASNMMKKPHVLAAVAEQMQTLLRDQAVDGPRVIKELARIAFANIDDHIDEDYQVNPQKASRAHMAAVQSVTSEVIIDKSKRDDEDEREDLHKITLKMYSKQDALNSLGKHFKLFTDVVEVQGNLVDLLSRAEQRATIEGDK